MQSDMLLIHKPFLKQVEQFSMAARQGKTSIAVANASDDDMNNMYRDMYSNWLLLTAPRQSGDVRIIPVRGALTYDDPYAVWDSASTTSKVEEYLDLALADESVSSIVLHIHSPGGSAYAIDTVANKIVTGKEKKPIYGYTDSIAASAAMWMFAACTKRFYGSQMAQMGSIGVYAAMFNYTEMLSKNGIKVDEYIAGKYKAAGSPYHTNTKEEKEIIQDQVDDLYTVFVESMATLLGKSVEDVLLFADGRTYTGAKAEKLGLCDSFLTLEGVINMAATKKEPTATASAEDKAAIATLNAANETADAALTAANLKVASLEAAQTDLATKLSAFTAEKDASDKKAAGEATKAECSTLYKTSLNREPTDAELSSFTTYSAEARTAFGAALTATAKPALGDLGKETALEGQTVAKKSVLASAFERLDNHNVKK